MTEKRNFLLLLFTVYFVIIYSSQIDRRPFINYIRHYEPINQFTTVKRILNVEHRYVKFQAFNRKFRLILRPKITAFLQNSISIEITNVKKTHQFPSYDIQNSFVVGQVMEEKNSSVSGMFIDNIFQGTIQIQNDVFHVEEAERYFSRPVPFQSLIFKQSDIYLNQTKNDSNIFCNYQENEMLIGAQKRRISKFLNLRGNTICTLKLFADHTFFQHSSDHEIIRVILEMFLLLEQAQSIFSTTDFDSDGEPEQIGFQVNAVQVILNRYSPNYRLYQEDFDIEDYLDLFADYDFDKFCLGLAITHRRFPSNALGVTYTASPNPRKAGGICQKRRRAKGQKKPKSYNSVVVTVVGQDGQLMPRFLNGLTVAHELGHAFGSDHDPPGDVSCSPYKKGDFLMSRYTLLGNDVHNYQFSPCSRRQIADVIREKGFCFVKRNPVCGNAIVEEGEECDCGTADQCTMVDPCCTPKGGLGSDDECTVRASQGYKCSPNGKPCCSSRCQFIPAHEFKDCTGGNDCYFAESCSGLSADCPILTPRPNGAECRNGLGRCLDSKCEDVTCAKRGLLECVCYDLKVDCQLCCKSKDNFCKPASTFGLQRMKNVPYQRPAGEECDDGQGYCNFAGECTTTRTRKGFEQPKVIPREEDASEDKIVNVITILVICVLVLSVIAFIVAAMYIFKPLRWFKKHECTH